MSTVTAEIRQLSKLDADTLADLYCAGEVSTEQLLAVDRADVQAAKAKSKRDADRSAWYDAAHAQYLAASEACRGHLFIPAARTMPGAPASDMALWTGSEAWARKWASEDLREWWDANGGRLSLATWQRQQAAQARAYRDERDMAAMAAQTAAAKPARPSARDLAIAAASRPVAPGSIARMIRALGAMERQATRTARVLQSVTGQRYQAGESGKNDLGMVTGG